MADVSKTILLNFESNIDSDLKGLPQTIEKADGSMKVLRDTTDKVSRSAKDAAKNVTKAMDAVEDGAAGAAGSMQKVDKGIKASPAISLICAILGFLFSFVAEMSRITISSTSFSLKILTALMGSPTYL